MQGKDAGAWGKDLGKISGFGENAGIFGMQGRDVWAQSPDFREGNGNLGKMMGNGDAGQ